MVVALDSRNVFAVAAKDIKETFSSISIYGPMMGIPLFFSIVLPILTIYVTMYAAPSIAVKLALLPVANLPANTLNKVSFMSFFSLNVLGPIFLTIPILTATVIAADSFSGEKERKTSEALLSTPISKSELLTGKILASLIPTILLTVGVFAIYGSIIDILSHGSFGVYILPNAEWLLMLASSPFFAAAAIGVVVIISAHVRGVKEAQQISSLLVLPVILLPFAAITGFADINVSFFKYLILALVLIDIAVIALSIKSFRKEAIL